MITKRILVAVFFACLAIPVAGEAGAAEDRYRRSIERYVVPDVVLVNQDGAKVHLRRLLETDKPVIMDFIFGTCTTICPVLSVSYVNLQRKLGPDTKNVHLVSISIDPENDTPEVMKTYLKKYRAKPGWDFLTGTRHDIDQVMLAFAAYVPDKMSHMPLTFIRSPKDGQWIRLFGIMSTADFLSEYEKVSKK